MPNKLKLVSTSMGAPLLNVPMQTLGLSQIYMNLCVNQDKTSLDFYGPSRVQCTGLLLSLTLSQTSRTPGAKEVIS